MNLDQKTKKVKWLQYAKQYMMTKKVNKKWEKQFLMYNNMTMHLEDKVDQTQIIVSNKNYKIKRFKIVGRDIIKSDE